MIDKYIDYVREQLEARTDAVLAFAKQKRDGVLWLTIKKKGGREAVTSFFLKELDGSHKASWEFVRNMVDRVEELIKKS